jgi:tetratricopeptide (TPR) repeat protein
MSTSILLSLAWVLSLADAPAAAPADALPEELSSLSLVWNDEKKLLEGVRQFDLIQQGLADWDRNLSSDHQMGGEEALAQDKLAQAKHRIDLIRRAYEEVLKRYPENARAHVYLGELYYDRLDNEGKGLELWQKALDLDPKLHEAMNDFAIHYSHIGDVPKSLEYFEKALKLAPDNADYLYNVTQIYLIQWPEVQKRYGWTAEQVYRKAMEYSKRAAQLRPDDYPLLSDYALNFFRGEQMRFTVNWDEAAQAWQKARERTRNSAEMFYTWLNEGRVWIRVGQKEKAMACLDQALKLFPDSKAAKNLQDELKAGR